MTKRFQLWFDWLMKWEGTTFENDPDDPGGATKFGIDQRSHPDENIRELTRERAAEIYWNEYWGKVKAEELPLKVGEIIANIAVNCGRSRATKWLQRAVGVDVDGALGAKTVSAAQKANSDELVMDLLDATETHYRAIAKGKLAKFLRGWLNRNEDLKQFVYNLNV